MRIDLIQSLDQMNSLAEEWNALLSKSAIHVPFLRHEYLNTWWQTLGGGEWKEGELCILTGRDDDERLCGIAPLFLTRNREGERALMLLGSIEISDYLDLIAPEQHLKTFVFDVIDFLAGPQAPDWQVLDLNNLLENSPSLPLLEKAAQQHRWHFAQTPLKRAPYIPLPDNWDDYLAALAKKQRHEVRRKLRRAAAYPAPVHWYIVHEEAKLDEEIEAFLRLMATDPTKANFLTQTMCTQIRAAIRNAFHTGWLQLAFLEVGEEKAAAYLNFDFANQIWVYNSGLNPEFRQLSPGWVLLAHLIQWAIEHGREAFDFMRGDEDYKYRLGGIDRYVVRAILRR